LVGSDLVLKRVRRGYGGGGVGEELGESEGHVVDYYNVAYLLLLLFRSCSSVQQCYW